MFDNIKKTRCLIDFDGTIANSLPWCNVALDEMFKGVLVDKHYIEYYKDFGDTFEIIPGCPWKRILTLLCHYHAKEQVVSGRDISNPVLPIVVNYDVGVISAMLKVAYGAHFVDYDANNIAYYEAMDSTLIGVVLSDIACESHLNATKQKAHQMGCHAWKILPITGYFAKTDPDMLTVGSNFCYIEDVENDLEVIFEEKVLRIMSERVADELEIDPVVEFCREYVSHGGSLVIQSGSNPAIISAILSVLCIDDIFDGMFCSPMFVTGDSDTTESPWEYKTRVISEAEKAFDDDKKCFVVGDTKGDAFGAYECELPFFLVWRGYPSNPSTLESAQGNLSVTDWIDCSQDKLDADNPDDFSIDATTMLNFADSVGKGNENPPKLAK